MGKKAPLRYSILDPTGNITALVESEVMPAQQPAVAARLMERRPQVEQVGFFSLSDDGHIQAELRMAGGEFCGNATMCAAALYLLRQQKKKDVPISKEEKMVKIKASGAEIPVTVRLRQETKDRFTAGVHMPQAQGIEEKALSLGCRRGRLPLVRMEGISHIIIEPDTVFYELLEDRKTAEGAVRKWCESLGAEGLGLMFLKKEGDAYSLTPLVYVPGSGTVFWENSCASGSSAAGMYLAEKAGAKVTLTFREPGGELRVESGPPGAETWLYGSTQLVGQGEESIDGTI